MSGRSNRVAQTRGKIWPLLEGAVRIVRRAFRLAVIAASILGLIAIGLGRVDRENPQRVGGEADVPIRVGVGVGGRPPYQDRFFDPETGRPVPVTLPGRGTLWGSGWAPWRDDHGRTQIVGRWMRESVGMTGENVLVRLSQPDGAVLDRLPLGGLPNWIGSPCWFSDQTPRILLAGGDGLLYRVDFGSARGLRLKQVPWHREGDRPSIVRIDDLSWPRDPRLGHRLLASLWVRPDVASIPNRDEWRLWWLQLDADETEVVAGGPISVREGSDPPKVDERFAILSPAAPPRLAWLERDRAGRLGPWRLRIASIGFDARSGAPVVMVGGARTLAEDCAMVAPAFSADGRLLTYMRVIDDLDSPRLRRLVMTAGDGPTETARAHPDDGGTSQIRVAAALLPSFGD